MKKNNLLKIFSFVIGLIFVFNVINISFANNLSENPVPLLDGFAQISKGIDFTLALDTDGKLYAWGDNYAGQFGDGTLIGSTIPKQIGTSIYSKISAGGYHSLALKADGTLWVWGYNANGRLGDNSTTSSIIPKQINGHIFSQISAGDNHSLALKEDGTLWAWGDNTNGQLGLGEGSENWSIIPIQIGENKYSQISAGNNYSLVLTLNNELFACGDNQNGKLGNGTTTRSKSLVSSGQNKYSQILAGVYHSMALDTDGKLFTWGNNSYGQLGNNGTLSVSSPTLINSDNYSQISSGDYHSLAIKSDGSLFAWGKNVNGELGISTMVSKKSPYLVGVFDYAQISAGNNNSSILNKDGSIIIFGKDSPTNPIIFSKLHDKGFSKISSKNSSILALKSDGTLWGWGRNDSYQLGTYVSAFGSDIPTQIGTNKYSQISVGTNYSLAIGIDEKLYAWGENSNGQLGNGTTNSLFVPTKIGDNNYSHISAGEYYSLAISTDGKLYAWGENSNGQLGNGTTNSLFVPTKIGDNNYSQISAALTHSLAIGIDEKLYAWGNNSNGQLGNGTTNSLFIPTKIGDNTYSQISAIYTHSFAISTNKNLYSWGHNVYESLGHQYLGYSNIIIPTIVGSTNDSYINISTGNFSSMAIKEDGTLWSWGLNTYGQLGNGTNINSPLRKQIKEGNYSQIIMNNNYNLALTTNGELWGSGANEYSCLSGSNLTPKILSLNLLVKDVVPPTVPIINRIFNDKFTITPGTDAKSGVKETQYSIDGGSTYNLYTPNSTIILPYREIKYEIKAKTIDNASNESEVSLDITVAPKSTLQKIIENPITKVNSYEWKKIAPQYNSLTIEEQIAYNEKANPYYIQKVTNSLLPDVSGGSLTLKNAVTRFKITKKYIELINDTAVKTEAQTQLNSSVSAIIEAYQSAINSPNTSYVYKSIYKKRITKLNSL